MPRQNTHPSDYPQAVLQQIEQLAQNIVIARKRRGETQAQWARKLGVSQPTMARIERGDPSVAMASYVMCMWLINQAAGLADLIAPIEDHAALEREITRVREPVVQRSAEQKYAVHAEPEKARNHVRERVPAAPTSTSTSTSTSASKPAKRDKPSKTANSAKAANAVAAGLAALLQPSGAKSK